MGQEITQAMSDYYNTDINDIKVECLFNNNLGGDTNVYFQDDDEVCNAVICAVNHISSDVYTDIKFITVKEVK